MVSRAQRKRRTPRAGGREADGVVEQVFVPKEQNEAFFENIAQVPPKQDERDQLSFWETHLAAAKEV